MSNNPQALGAIANVNSLVGQGQQTLAKAAIPDELANIINHVVKSIDGMYQFSGFKDPEKIATFKTELTKGLYVVRDQVTPLKIKEALNYFRTQGGKFPPSVPEIIKTILGKHEEKTRKPPEHRWFDKSRAISSTTEAQRMASRDKYLAEIRAKLKQGKPKPKDDECLPETDESSTSAKEKKN